MKKKQRTPMDDFATQWRVMVKKRNDLIDTYQKVLEEGNFSDLPMSVLVELYKDERFSVKVIGRFIDIAVAEGFEEFWNELPNDTKMKENVSQMLRQFMSYSDFQAITKFKIKDKSVREAFALIKGVVIVRNMIAVRGL